MRTRTVDQQAPDETLRHMGQSDPGGSRKKGMHHDWTQDEIGEIIKNKYAEINRLPMSKDFTPAENSLITKHCAGVNFAAEKFLGNSVRVEIMRCIDQLMPSGVDAPTTQEIYFSMKQKGFTLNIDEIRGVLNFTVRQQYLENGRYDRTVWWKLTPAGKEFLKQFKGKKDGNRT